MQRPTSNTEEIGQLFISVRESKDISPTSGSGAYCVIQLDKQQIKTQGVHYTKSSDGTSSYEPWNEGYTFDITNINASLTVAVFGTNEGFETGQHVDNSEGRLIGQVVISVHSLLNQKPVDTWFKLVNPKQPKLVPGDIHLKLQYTPMTRKICMSDFELLKVIGRGSFAKVMLVRKTDTGRLYAMKAIKKDNVIKYNAVAYTMSEKNILTRIQHPFIISLKYAFQTEDQLCMILDYICGGELFYHLSEAERFSEERSRYYAAEIACALGYLHNMGILYRDLKPENILLDLNGHVVLTDFGLCKEGLGIGNVTHTFCGSPEYLAPEIYLGRGYDKTADWWALGTVLYEMLTGLPPFFSEDADEMNQKILYETLVFPSDFSKDAKSLLSGLLERNPKKRLGAGKKGTEDIKKHPFFKNIDWKKLENKELDPPFRPHLKNEFDFRFFDPETTSETPRHSILRSNLTKNEQDLFEGFSYVAPAEKHFAHLRKRTFSGSNSRLSGSSSSGRLSPAVFEASPLRTVSNSTSSEGMFTLELSRSGSNAGPDVASMDKDDLFVSLQRRLERASLESN